MNPAAPAPSAMTVLHRQMHYLVTVATAVGEVAAMIHDRHQGTCNSGCPGCLVNATLCMPAADLSQGLPDVQRRLEVWIERAVADPASIAGPRRGPTWPMGSATWAPHEETTAAWIARAVANVVTVGGRPICRRCRGEIRVDHAYGRPARGADLWEHQGMCPPAAAPPPAGAVQWPG